MLVGVRATTRELTAFLLGTVSGTLLLSLLRRRSIHSAVEQRVECLECTGACDAPADDDAHWLAVSHAHRLRRRRKPSQSCFRVTAVVVFGVEGGRLDRFTVGHNDEACVLKNSACAERAAFLHLSALAQGAELRVHAVYITSDAAFALTPGALCREYMQSSPWVTRATRVVMEGTAGAVSRAEMNLAALWPQPSVYTRLTRAEQMDLGSQLGPAVRPPLEAAAAARTPEGIAWSAAVEAASHDASPDLHPVRYGAAVVFSDGSVASAWQKKALEYSCSLDPVCQLAQAIADCGRATAAGLSSPSQGPGQPPATPARVAVAPVLVCMADQFGVCHAPSAAGRAFLAEHGHGACRVMAHDDTGRLHTPTADALMPRVPDFASHLS